MNIEKIGKLIDAGEYELAIEALTLIDVEEKADTAIESYENPTGIGEPAG